MLTIYTSPSCSSCRKAKEFLREQNLPFIEKNIINSVLNESELKEILAKSENGTDDIISKRSKVIKESKIDVDQLTIPQLIQFIKKNPTILKRPIIVSDRLVQVGYNEEEIEVFVPRVIRAFSRPCDENCEHFNDCFKE